MAEPIEVPHRVIARIRTILVPDDVTRHDFLELRARIHEKNLNAREFASLLEVTDRLYGTFSPHGHRKYARRREEQLQIEAIEPGSVDLTLLQSLGIIIESHSIIAISILWWTLRQFGPLAKNMAEAFKEYEHGALIKDLRKNFRQKRIGEKGADVREADELTAEDEDVEDVKEAELIDADVAAISRFLDAVFKGQRPSLNKAGRFAHDQMTDIFLRVIKKD
jgi:hypothetical protein